MVRDSSCSWSPVCGIRRSTPSGDSSDVFVNGSAILVRASSISWLSVRGSSISGLRRSSPCGLPPSWLTTAGRLVRFFLDFVVFGTRILDMSLLPSFGLLSFALNVLNFDLSTRVTGAAHAYRENGSQRHHGSSHSMRGGTGAAHEVWASIRQSTRDAPLGGHLDIEFVEPGASN